MSAQIFSQILAILVLWASISPSSAQNPSDVLRLFGGLMQGAVTEAARAEWRKLPRSELACIELELQQRGASIAALAQQGIAPADGRLASIRAACATTPAIATIQPQPASPPEALSATPTYDCTKAKSASGRILCTDPAGAKADWDMSAVYWATLFTIPESDRDAFKRSHENWVQSLSRACRLIADQPSYSPQQTRCVLSEFRTRTSAYRSRLGGDALAEARLTPEQHAAIQAALSAFGLFDGIVDGEFGPRTRTAIRLYQERSGEAPGDFLTSAQTARLTRGAQPTPEQQVVRSASSVPPDAQSSADDATVRASNLTVADATSQCQSDDTDKRLVGCTAIINARGKGYGIAMADAFDGRCRSYNSLGQYARAAEDCRTAIGLNGRHAYAHNNLAEALRGLGDLEGSIAAYTKSIELKPNFIYSYLGRADALAKSGDKESARQDLDKVLTLDPANQRARDSLASLAIDTPALKETRIFLDDVRKFISEQSTAPSAISDIAAAAASLQTALTAFDERAALAARARLNDLLSPLKDFADFRAGRNVERSRELARQFTLAQARAEQQVRFVAEFLRQNLGYTKTEALLALKNRLDGALKPPATDERAIAELDKAISDLDGFVRDNSLSADYKRLTEPSPTPAVKSAAAPAIDQLQTEKNSIAVAGAPDDLVLLFNASRSAPSVAKDIGGQFVFLTGTASVCFAQSAMDTDRVWYLERTLREQGARDVRFEHSPCDLSSLVTSIDIAAFQRGELRKQQPDYVVGLLDLLQNDSLREYRTVTEADYNNDIQNTRARSLRIARDVESGKSMPGFGVLAVTNAPVPACVVADERVAERGLKELIDTKKDQISPRLRSGWSVVESTLDNAFIALAREKCGYAIADAAGLRTLVHALRRDGRKYEFAPIWFSTEEVTAAGTEALRAEHDQAEKQIGDAKISEALHRQREATREAATTVLRDQNGVRARGLKDHIQKAIKKAADKPLTSNVRTATEIQNQFPSFSAWLDKRFDEQWETTSVTSDIADYGTIKWNGRTLEGIIVRAQIEQKNAILGMRRTDCFTFGLVNDDEFDVERDPFDVACSNERDVVPQWKVRRQFKSRWNAE